MAKSNMAAIGYDENPTFLFLGVYAHVIPLFGLIGVWGIHF